LHERYPIDDIAEALAEGIVTGHPTTAEFRLDPAQVNDVIAYLNSLHDWIRRRRPAARFAADQGRAPALPRQCSRVERSDVSGRCPLNPDALERGGDPRLLGMPSASVACDRKQRCRDDLGVAARRYLLYCPNAGAIPVFRGGAINHGFHERPIGERSCLRAKAAHLPRSVKRRAKCKLTP
jgi:hypothetical protein